MKWTTSCYRHMNIKWIKLDKPQKAVVVWGQINIWYSFFLPVSNRKVPHSFEAPHASLFRVNRAKGWLSKLVLYSLWSMAEQRMQTHALTGKLPSASPRLPDFYTQLRMLITQWTTLRGLSRATAQFKSQQAHARTKKQLWKFNPFGKKKNLFLS